MAKSTVEVELITVVNAAKKSIDKFASDTQKQLDGINFKSTVSAISDGFNLIDRVAGGAFRTISGYLKDAINEALEAEKANIQLAQSMKLVGDFTEDALKSFNDLSTELSRTSEFTDDQIVAASALAKAYNLTNKEAEKVIRAAVELSAVTGQDLNSSVESLAKTFNGLVSKELKSLIPELRLLTKTQLENGDAVEILLNRYKGTSETITDTFGGAVNQLIKSFGQLSESFGNQIVKNDDIKTSIQSVASEVNALADAIEEGNLTEIFFNIRVGEGVSDTKKRLQEIKADAVDAEAAIAALLDESKRAQRLGQRSGIEKADAEESIKARRKLFQDREKAEQDFNSMVKSLRTANLTEVERLEKDAQDKIKVIRDASRLGIDTQGLDLKKAEADVRIQLEKDTLKVITDLNKKEADARRAAIEQATANPIKATLELSAKGAIDSRAAIGIGAGLVASIAKGAQGAGGLVSQGLGAIADTLLPGIGGAVSEIVGILAQGPEKVREQVREFAKALPQVIEAIVSAVPVLVEEIVNAVPQIIAKLVEAAPRVIDALIDAAPGLITAVVTQLPKIATELAKLMPFVAFQFSAALIKNIPQIVFQIAQGIFNAMIGIVNSIFNYVVDFLNSLNPFSSDDGGFLGLGLAEGGRVPDRSQFAGDRFPARLDAGEQVLSRDLSSRLEDFLNGGGGSGQPLQINLNIGLEQFAKVMLEADRLGYRVRA